MNPMPANSPRRPAARPFAMLGTLSFLAMAGLCAGPALAQQRLQVQELNFDMWCQQTQHLSFDRCGRRLKEDTDAFDAYRGTIEKYEVEDLKRRQSEQQLDRTVLHADPMAHPLDKSPADQAQQLTQPPAKTQP